MQASLVSTYRVCCNKRSRKFDFGVLECGGNWRAALERERCLFQIQQNYLHESSKLGSYSFQITTYNYHYIPELQVIFNFSQITYLFNTHLNLVTEELWPDFS